MPYNSAQQQEYHKKPEVQKRQADGKKRRRADNRAFVESLKLGKSCGVCGETHPACLDFHHRDPSTKMFTIADWAGGRQKMWSRETLLFEVAKCDLICKNCHAKLHWEQRQLSD